MNHPIEASIKSPLSWSLADWPSGLRYIETLRRFPFGQPERISQWDHSVEVLSGYRHTNLYNLLSDCNRLSWKSENSKVFEFFNMQVRKLQPNLLGFHCQMDTIVYGSHKSPLTMIDRKGFSMPKQIYELIGSKNFVRTWTFKFFKKRLQSIRAKFTL